MKENDTRYKVLYLLADCLDIQGRDGVPLTAELEQVANDEWTPDLAESFENDLSALLDFPTDGLSPLGRRFRMIFLLADHWRLAEGGAIPRELFLLMENTMGLTNDLVTQTEIDVFSRIERAVEEGNKN